MQLQQASTHPPAQPTYILRGHTAAIHSVCFLRQNSRLLTGDADGWVVLWNVAIKRAVAVWKAHEGSILGLKVWGTDKIITHGRDTKLNVWQVDSASETSLSKSLPVDDSSAHRPQPWLLHSLSVNTLNFCSFAMCPAQTPYEPGPHTGNDSTSLGYPDSVHIAVPGIKDDHIDIFQLPSERRLWTISPPSQPVTSPLKQASPGMVMALALHNTPSHLLLAAGYEAGTTHLFSLAHSNIRSAPSPRSASTPSTPQPTWRTIYTSTPHTQPILSLSLAPFQSCYFTSSADSIIARHPLPSQPTPHTSQTNPAPQSTPPPFKSIQTHHSGQQSLTLRSDARIFATAGWDGRIRVYSTRTMNELAVLKWHKEGCYCCCFAEILENADDGRGFIELGGNSVGGGGEYNAGDDVAGATGRSELAVGNARGEGRAGPEERSLMEGKGTTRMMRETVGDKRDKRARQTHWLAAGSKDGKVSLWDIY